MQYVVSSHRHQPGGFPSSSSEANGKRHDTKTGVEASSGTAVLSVTDDIPKTYTVEEAIESIGFGIFQLKIFLVGHLILAGDAMEIMIVAILSPLLRCDWHLDSVQVAFITTAIFVGMGLSAPLWGIIGDTYGRKVALFMVTIVTAYFGILTSFTPSYGWLWFFQFLVGLGLSGCTQGFSLNAEYLPSKHRAKLLTCGKTFFTIGTLFEIMLAMIVVPALGWRWLLVFSAIPFLICAICLLWIPESARFLVAAGHVQHASRILEDAAKANSKSLPEGVLVQSKEVPRGRIKDLFTHEYFRSTLQMCFIWFGAYFSYYGIVLASAEILMIRNAANNSFCKCTYLRTDDYITLLLSTCGEFLSVPINLMLLDRFGRRITIGVCFWGVAIFAVPLQLNVSQSVLSFFMFSVRAFVLATSTCVYIYASELYPTSVRTLGIGFLFVFSRIGSMSTPFVAQIILSSSIATATWVYGTVCFVCGICAFLLPIETLGRPLPQHVENKGDK